MVQCVAYLPLSPEVAGLSPVRDMGVALVLIKYNLSCE